MSRKPLPDEGPGTRKRRSACALSLAALLVIPLTCSVIAAAHAENWISSGDACLDIDSVHLVNEAKVGDALVAYRVSSCQNGHPDPSVFLLGVKRQECPAIIKGASSFAAFMFRSRDNSWQMDTKGYLAREAFRGLAFTACRMKGAPDGLVEFDNYLSQGTATIYLDGTQVCRLNSMSDTFVGNTCDVDLRRFGTDAQFRHSVRIVAPRGDVNDTVSIADCHWNWQGTKQFEIKDSRVHFGCM